LSSAVPSIFFDLAGTNDRQPPDEEIGSGVKVND
jgi:hypothetical protein